MMRLAWRDRLELQLGVQRADYRREVSSGVSGQSDAIDEQPWMGAASASFALDNGLRAYAAYARGFEDSGRAPASPRTRAKCCRRRAPSSGTPGCAGRWAAISTWSHPCSGWKGRTARSMRTGGSVCAVWCAMTAWRLSLVSHPIEGLSVVAGLLGQHPRMVDAPEGIGPLAVAIAEYSGIVEVDYEPAHWRGFGSAYPSPPIGPAEAKADNSVETESYTTLDLGLRYSFEVRNAPVSVRASVTNVTDNSRGRHRMTRGSTGFSSGHSSWSSRLTFAKAEKRICRSSSCAPALPAHLEHRRWSPPRGRR
jgi:hypothetical protein